MYELIMHRGYGGGLDTMWERFFRWLSRLEKRGGVGGYRGTRIPNDEDKESIRCQYCYKWREVNKVELKDTSKPLPCPKCGYDYREGVAKMEAQERLAQLVKVEAELELIMAKELPDFVKEEAQFKLDNTKKEIEQLKEVLKSHEVREAVRRIREL